MDEATGSADDHAYIRKVVFDPDARETIFTGEAG
jgi:hypothetical protein